MTVIHVVYLNKIGSVRSFSYGIDIHTLKTNEQLLPILNFIEYNHVITFY